MNRTMAKKEEGLLLALDTSTSSMTVAVMRKGELLGERTSRAERNHSIYLVPAMQELLAEHGLRLADLEAIAVGHGPGSYTGVRIGITVAKTTAWSLGLPVIAVSSLEAIAFGAAEALGREEAGTVWVVPLMDARRGQAFTGLYASDSEGGWSVLQPDGVRQMQAWADELAELAAASEQPPRRVLFTGQTETFADPIEHFAALWCGGETAVHPHELQARAIGRLAYPRWLAGETAEPHGLVPNYTQLAEAEVKLLRKRAEQGN